MSTDEIHNHVKNLKKGKAPGPDCLTNEHILYGGNTLLSELCELFNSILKSKYVPEMFKTGKIITVYKGKNKDKYNPVNYRGITLTSVLSKLFEKIVLKRIENSLIDKKISFPHELQFGCRDDHGAVPACSVLKECISFYVTKRSPVFCTFLDNKKAFDRIWHNVLLYKLYILGIDPYIWFILRDWYYKS